MNLSLKWKILLVTSAVFSALVVTVTYLQSQMLLEQQQRSRERVHAYYVDTVEGLIVRSADRLRQIGKSIVSAPGILEAMAARQPAGVLRAFDSQWPVLSFEQEIDFVMFHDAQGESLGRWGEYAAYASVIELAVNRSREQVAPFTVSECADQCVQLMSVPIQHKGQLAGVVTVGASVADVVLAFKTVTGADIGLLTPSREQAGSQTRVLPKWGLEVLAMTRIAENLKFLQEVSRQLPIFDQAQSSENRIVNLGDETKEVLFLPMHGIEDAVVAYLVMLVDVGQEARDIRLLIWRTIAVALIGLLTTAALLMVILSRVAWQDSNVIQVQESLRKFTEKQ